MIDQWWVHSQCRNMADANEGSDVGYDVGYVRRLCWRCLWDWRCNWRWQGVCAVCPEIQLVGTPPAPLASLCFGRGVSCALTSLGVVVCWHTAHTHTHTHTRAACTLHFITRALTSVACVPCGVPCGVDHKNTHRSHGRPTTTPEERARAAQLRENTSSSGLHVAVRCVVGDLGACHAMDAVCLVGVCVWHAICMHAAGMPCHGY